MELRLEPQAASPCLRGAGVSERRFAGVDAANAATLALRRAPADGPKSKEHIAKLRVNAQ